MKTGKGTISKASLTSLPNNNALSEAKDECFDPVSNGGHSVPDLHQIITKFKGQEGNRTRKGKKKGRYESVR